MPLLHGNLSIDHKAPVNQWTTEICFQYMYIYIYLPFHSRVVCTSCLHFPNKYEGLGWMDESTFKTCHPGSLVEGLPYWWGTKHTEDKWWEIFIKISFHVHLQVLCACVHWVSTPCEAFFLAHTPQWLFPSFVVCYCCTS